MERDNNVVSPPTGNGFRHVLRVVRPLIWWFMLVLVLFGIRTHQRLMEQTRINFSVTLAGRPLASASGVSPLALFGEAEVETRATLDGRRVESGQRLGLGRHNFTLTHPKADPFTTNLFTWYGGHHLGTIDLKRARGTLAVAAHPPARRLAIHGPEFSQVWTNVPGMTSSVPTDRYVIEAQFKHVTQQETVPVVSGAVLWRDLSPKLGVVEVTCDQQAGFELRAADGRVLEQGTTPARLTEIPAGAYRLVTRHKDHRVEKAVTVGANATNAVRLEFRYGAAVLETDPPGATVTRDNRKLGITPLTLRELPAGQWVFDLEREDHEPVSVALEVSAEQTTRVRTNLVNRHYVRALRAAENDLASRRYESAVEQAAEALRHKPDDPAAMALQRKAQGFGHLANARVLEGRGEFATAIVAVNTALQFIPDNAEAQQLLADYSQREKERGEAQKQREAALAEQERKKREAEEAERESQAAIQHLRQAFQVLAQGFPDAAKFREQELVTTNAVRRVGEAIRAALVNEPPAFTIVRMEWSRPDLFGLQARQRVGAGYRDCLIVGGQVREGEARVLFKVLEYENPPDVNLLGGLLRVTASAPATPQDPALQRKRAERWAQQVQEGSRIVTERIRGAMEQ